MSFWIMLVIMATAAVVGGIINYLLPANSKDGKYIKPWEHCMILGFGATLLVPIFLELAQSKLMDNIHFNWTWEQATLKDLMPQKRDTTTITIKYDTTNKRFKSDTTNPKLAPIVKEFNISRAEATGKHYLLWAAYCLLAAAAGYRFIDMLISKIVLQQKLEKTEEEREQLRKSFEKQTKQSEIKGEYDAEADRKKIALQAANLAPGAQVIIPVVSLPEIKYKDDPQKGRFGGLAEKNGRKLNGEVKQWSNDPEWFRVKLLVRSIDAANPLIGNVTFYLHNTFYKSVRTIPVNNGIAELKLNQVYGAFTVGAIADNGNTLLELDLAEQDEFPKTFRER